MAAAQQQYYAQVPMMATQAQVPGQYVAAVPQYGAPMPQQMAQAQMMAPPQKLTEGFPDPASVEKQKAAYEKGLEKQLKENSDMVSKRSEAEKEQLLQQAAQQKAAFNLQLQTQLQQQWRALDEQTNAQMLALQEAAAQQKSTLEGQAAGIKLEWEQRKAQEDMMIRQYDISKQYYEAQVKLQEQAIQYTQPAQAAAAAAGQPAQAMAAAPPGMVAVPQSAAVVPMMPQPQTFMQPQPSTFIAPTGTFAPGVPASIYQGAVPATSMGRHYSIPALEPGAAGQQ